jgi:4,5-DOPA dioxygenase extradiol
MDSLRSFKTFSDGLPEQEYLMPVLFIGHGSPMNGIQDNDFSRGWKAMADKLPVPAAVLVISAHWLSKGTRITAMDFPETIHDFGGFPQALFDVQYPAPGLPSLAKETASLFHSTQVELDHDWGLDHGAWTVVRHMYPQANVPVLQLSIDYTKGPAYHFELAKELSALRRKGVLIMGSGNMVHNLRMVAWDRMDEPGYGYDWALNINEKFKSLIMEENYQPLFNYQSLGSDAMMAIPTPEHYMPLMYTLGLKQHGDDVSFFNDKAVAGSLTMTSVKIG